MEEANRPGRLPGDTFEVIEKSTNRPVPFGQLTPFDKDPEFFSSKYRLRQLTGDNNALGNLKFMFPNFQTNTPSTYTTLLPKSCLRICKGFQPRLY